MAEHTPPLLGEHPDVAPIEQILASATARADGSFVMRGGRVIADRAVWLCACVHLEDCIETPTWLIYDTAGGAFGWQRMTADDVAHVIDTELVTGDHVSPESLLSWLEGREAQWWPGRDDADRAVIADLGRRIRELTERGA